MVRRYRGIIIWTLLALCVVLVGGLGFCWWSLSRNPSRFGDFLGAGTAWMVAQINTDGRKAAVSALLSARDEHSHISDPAWCDLIRRKLEGTPEEQMLMLKLLRHSCRYGAGSYEQGNDPPERIVIGRLASATDASIDPQVRLAARRCWRGNQGFGEVAYRRGKDAILLDEPIPSSPITPDGWRPGRFGFLLLHHELSKWIGVSEKDLAGVARKIREELPTLIAGCRDRRDEVLLFTYLITSGADGPLEPTDQYNQAVLVMGTRLFADDRWLDDVWDQGTTTAILLARQDLLFYGPNWPAFQASFARFYEATIRWCLKQDPRRLPAWRAAGQEVAAGDLERFTAWLLATRLVVGLKPGDGVSSEVRELSAPLTLPVMVEVIPDPGRCSPFGLSLTALTLSSEAMHQVPRRLDWLQWDTVLSEWAELEQTATPDHQGLDGLWPARGEVDALWRSMLMSVIDDAAPANID